MFCRIYPGWVLALVVAAPAASGQVELANLREDVRGLTQRVGELSLRVEQLERENQQLKLSATNVNQSYVTLTQLNSAINELNTAIRGAVSSSKAEVLQQVGAEMEKLAKQTNAAIEALAKSAATRPVVQATFAENYPKEGVAYTVQKGDTLPAIAKKTGAKVQDIINANKITDPSRINIGQTLFIPGGQ
jgi:LysM repeat protein